MSVLNFAAEKIGSSVISSGGVRFPVFVGM